MNYDIINLEIDSGLIRKKVKAYQLNEYFAAVSHNGGWQLYLLHNGKRPIKCTFLRLEDAKTFANFYSDLYSDYFIIWRDYPNADIPAWVKWTVNHGIDAHKFIESLKDKEVHVLDELPTG